MRWAGDSIFPANLGRRPGLLSQRLQQNSRSYLPPTVGLCAPMGTAAPRIQPVGPTLLASPSCVSSGWSDVLVVAQPSSTLGPDQFSSDSGTTLGSAAQHNASQSLHSR